LAPHPRYEAYRDCAFKEVEEENNEAKGPAAAAPGVDGAWVSVADGAGVKTSPPG